MAQLAQHQEPPSSLDPLKLISAVVHMLYNVKMSDDKICYLSAQKAAIFVSPTREVEAGRGRAGPGGEARWLGESGQVWLGNRDRACHVMSWTVI